MAAQDRCVTIHPYFKVSEGKLDAFRELCDRAVSMTSQEQKCLYYGFSFNGNEVFCREGYQGAEGALAHLANVRPILEEELRMAELIRLEIHGAEGELAKLREPFAEFNPTYFALEYGIRR